MPDQHSPVLQLYMDILLTASQLVSGPIAHQHLTSVLTSGYQNEILQNYMLSMWLFNHKLQQVLFRKLISSNSGLGLHVQRCIVSLLNNGASRGLYVPRFSLDL